MFRFVIRAFVSAEDHIHQRRDVAIIACVAIAVVVPVVQFRRADHRSQRAESNAHIRVDVNGPDATEGDEPSRRNWRYE